MDTNNKGFACLGIVVFGFMSIVFTSILNGYVLCTFWNWFVVSQFASIPQITIAGAIGLSMTMKLFAATIATSNQKDKTTTELVTEFITYSIGYPLMVLVMGYIIHLFM